MGFFRTMKNVGRGVSRVGRGVGHTLGRMAPAAGLVGGALMGGAGGALIGSQLGSAVQSLAPSTMTSRTGGTQKPAYPTYDRPSAHYNPYSQPVPQSGYYSQQTHQPQTMRTAVMPHQKAMEEGTGEEMNSFAHGGRVNPYGYRRGGQLGLRELMEQLRILKAHANGGMVDGMYADGGSVNGGYDNGMSYGGYDDGDVPGYNEGGMADMIREGVDRMSPYNRMNSYL